MTRDNRDGSAPTKDFGATLNPNALRTMVSPPPTIEQQKADRPKAAAGHRSRSGTSAGRAGSSEPSKRPGTSPGWSDHPESAAEPAAGARPDKSGGGAKGKGSPAVRQYNSRDTMPDGPIGLSADLAADLPAAAAAVMPVPTDSKRTVMMQPVEVREVREMREPRMLSVADPPEINLTQHTLPTGRQLDARLVLATRPDSERASSFRVLRHHIMENGRPQVIVVSSPNAREGKTTVAVNLALALSECARARVLLLEASLRRPQLAVIFRFEPPWCFAEQLTAHRHQPLLPWGFVNIPELYLHVAAIDPRVDQRQLLDAPAFAIAMERLRLAKYDHIVIDAPAILGSAEVNLMQDAADGVLLTALSRSTTARDMRQAVYQLTPTKILGTVLVEQ